MQEICAGYDTEITVISVAREPSKLTSPDSGGLKAISDGVRKLYPNVIVAPYITIGGTDAYKYQTVSDNIYRFMPMRLNAHELGLFHNQNEYISIENYENMIRYFHWLMRSYQNYGD